MHGRGLAGADLDYDSMSGFFQSNSTETLYLSYPPAVPFYPLRLDTYTHESIVSGVIEKLGGLPDLNRPESSNVADKHSLQEFKKILQCSPEEPDLQGKHSSISLLKLMQPTREIVELICTWAETECQPWRECHKIRDTFKQGRIKDHMSKMIGAPYQVRLFHVVNSTLFLDWPWGVSRFEDPPESMLLPIRYVLAMVRK